jgi:hypothetical protein
MAVDAMVTSGVPMTGSASQSGFGLVITELEGHRRIWHGGVTTGFRAILEHFHDDDLTIAVLTNYHGGGMVRLIEAVTRVALRVREQ